MIDSLRCGAYVSEVMGWPFGPSDGIRDVVVRVFFGGDASGFAYAERGATVLENVGGVAAPEL